MIGAVFGQTEGLLGGDLDLRELQQTGKIGRIEVNITSTEGNSEGEIIIPSALDAPETSLLAATLETIERIGPCQATITLESVEDTRSDKRKFVVEKAKEILKGLMETGESATEISEQIKESVRTQEVTAFKGLPAGPEMEASEEIIIVEGRADIVNLLKYGIKNTIAIEGTSIPQAVVDLTKEKVCTLFVDGDRGGQLISKELFQKADVDFVATAPEGKEVEDLTRKEVFKSLRERVPAQEFKGGLQWRAEGRKRFQGFRQERQEREERFERQERKARSVRLTPWEKDLFRKTLEDLIGTRAACIFSPNYELLGKVPVSELQNALKTTENPHAIVFDGKVDFSLNSLAKRKGVKFLVGMDREDFNSSVAIVSRADLE